ncbi:MULTISPECIES: FecR family protein [Mesoflavibacter]|uniref:FecR family protein n=1 Tax=Mesoflavibacter profundi TaxID=2708110 RepID=A0ABT4S3G9_9FLAO|nr:MULTISPECIES: FecR family protein [Mesoflavibacter]MDA0178579.1 FecR family protein [Mesoflavibacter profundi]QIJ89518.1 Putative anti-sigma factor [Mesoflavibacter sp. HG96]QIJ92246.1 Putative anti-sigma factor [Mesoflavibacter sp. HG37]
MEKEYLIKKWLDNNLSDSELEAFKSLEDYDALVKLSNYSKGFKAPNFNQEAILDTIISQPKATPKKENWIVKALKVAAILVLCFSAYYYTTTLDTSYSTDFAEKKWIELPDHSTVNLNALSNITYNKNNWKTTRDINLQGEAFFNVEKGSSFNVITNNGTVTVLGTAFNVKHRDNFFEVTCYQGRVKVIHKDKTTILAKGETFLVVNGIIINRSTALDKPQWLSNTSAFKSIPLKEVIAEFERQYNVKVTTKNINTDLIFTGRFTHDNIDTALKSITLPIQLTYTKTNNTIILTRE